MKAFFVLFLSILSASAQIHSPKHKAFLDSLGAPMAKTAIAPAAVTPPAIVGALMWNYPAEQVTNVLFDVYHSTAPAAGPPLTRYDQIPSGFTLLITVTGPPVPIGGLQQEFFIVRARDIVSGVVSNWNVK